MSERLIMLDVPGVLYSDRSNARLGGTPNTGTLRDVRFFDPIALGYIRRLFGVAGARVVVSDVWRRGTPSAILQQLDLQVEGMTPPVAGGHSAEITAYFASRVMPSSYVILSCASPESMTEAQREHLVSIDPAEGLTVGNFRQALDILGVACPSTLAPAPKLDAGLKAKLAQLQQLAREKPARFDSPAQPIAVPQATAAVPPVAIRQHRRRTAVHA